MSWMVFFVEVVTGLLVMILPGMLSLASMGVCHLAALIFAPSASIVLYVLFGVLVHSLGVPASGALLVVLSCIPACFISTVRLICDRQNGLDKFCNQRGEYKGESQHDSVTCFGSLRTYAFYIAIGLVACGIFFIIPLDGPDSFSSSSDNAYHLSLIRSFLDSKSFCTLHCSVFPDAVGNGTFYPAAWHIVAAIVADLFGGTVTAAANVVNSIVLFFIYPSGFFCLLGNYFGIGTRRHLFGSVACLCFAAFPWGFLNWGQLAPLLLAFSLVPLFVYQFRLVVLSDCLPSLRQIVLVVVFFAALAFAHPSAVFTAGVFCIPAIYQSLCKHVLCVPVCLKRSRKPFLLFATVVGVALVWIAAYRLPFLGGIVGFQWGGDKSLPDAVLSAIFNYFGGLQAPQYLLGIIVLVGFFAAFFIKPLRFLCGTYLFILILYVVNSITTAELQHLLTGFWYTDPYRVGAMLVMAGIPLACIGFDSICGLIKPRVASRTAKALQYTPLLVLAVLIYFPSITLPDGSEVITGFGRMVDHLSYSYSQDSAYGLDAQERGFIKQVEAMTGGERIINCPYDGSIYLYGATGLNTQYRIFKGEVDEGDLIPGKLSGITSNGSVKSQIDQCGARYVLMLDADWPASGTADQNVDVSAWEGIAGITESTPGFELVLAEGDMRLFEITR